MNIRGFFTKKKIIWGSIILVILFLIGFAIFRSKNNTSNILTDTVKKQDLKQTVLATGTVTSTTDLNLSFKLGGVVSKINVAVGDKVSAGQILANIDQKDQAASLTSARGSLASAQANYEKVLAGTSSEQVALAQASVDAAQTALNNAISQQKILVANALSNFLNSTPSAVPGSNNSSTPTIIITGTYNKTAQGTYTLSSYLSGDGLRILVSGLESANFFKTIPSAPLGQGGLFVTFTGTVSAGDTWTIEIPNTRALDYAANYNAYQAALQTQQTAVSSAQSTLDTAQAQLNLQKAQARPADIQLAQAQILSAQGQYQAALSAWENTIIRAPASGTITSVDIKVGELATATKEAVVLQNVDQLHLEAQISEANVTQIIPGQTVDVTFDAIGPDQHYNAVVASLDPASTVISGVVNYKLVATLGKTNEIKPGMTANLTVLTGQKSGVLAIPQRAVIENGSQKTVRVVNNATKKTYNEVEVQTGLEADGGLVEITSGLSEGQEIITFINKK